MAFISTHITKRGDSLFSKEDNNEDLDLCTALGVIKNEDEIPMIKILALLAECGKLFATETLDKSKIIEMVNKHTPYFSEV